MHALDLRGLTLHDCWNGERPASAKEPHFRVAEGGGDDLAFIYCEIPPGGEVGTHQDSAEEFVHVIEGVLEGWIGKTRRTVRAGEVLFIPAMAPHGFRNTSPAGARFLGLFAASRVVSTFERPLAPWGERVLETPSPQA